MTRDDEDRRWLRSLRAPIAGYVAFLIAVVVSPAALMAAFVHGCGQAPSGPDDAAGAAWGACAAGATMSGALLGLLLGVVLGAVAARALRLPRRVPLPR